jgi:hypothetical protein
LVFDHLATLLRTAAFLLGRRWKSAPEFFRQQGCCCCRRSSSGKKEIIKLESDWKGERRREIRQLLRVRHRERDSLRFDDQKKVALQKKRCAAEEKVRCRRKSSLQKQRCAAETKWRLRKKWRHRNKSVLQKQSCAAEEKWRCRKKLLFEKTCWLKAM